MFLFKKDQSRDNIRQINQKDATPFQVVGLTFNLLYQRLNIWIYINFLFILSSVGIMSAPAGKYALYHTIMATFKDPGNSRTNHFSEMKNSFKSHFWSALLLAFVKWSSLGLIVWSLLFWLNQESILFKLLSVISIYGLIEWGLITPYIMPILLEHPEISVFDAYKMSFILTSKNPVQALFFFIVNLFLLILGMILLGPVLLFLPTLRAMLFVHSYWYLSGEEIPGFIEIDKYVNTHYANQENEDI